MSFGASPSDIIIVVTFARRLYRSCKNAGGEYLEISREVRGLHTVLKHLKYEVEAPESILNRDRARYGRELAPVIGDCDYTLRQLDDLLMKYGRLSHDDPTAGRLWDKIRFGSNEMDELGSIRMKLINHKTSITLFLDTIQLHESSKMATALDNQTGQLEVILDKVDNIAARLGQRAGSVLTTYDDDDKEVWKQFRRELVAEGFSSDVLQQHKDVLRAYIREIDQNGYLEDADPDPEHIPHPGIDPEEWIEAVPYAESESNAIPPSFSSLNVNSEHATSKMLAVSEENMKFPQSIKQDMLQSSMALKGDSEKQLFVSPTEKGAVPKEGIGDSKALSEETDNCAVSDDDLRSPTVHEQQQTISTKDMLKPSALDIPKPRRKSDTYSRSSPMGSPSSFRSSASFAGNDHIPTSLQHDSAHLAPQFPQYGASPRSSFQSIASAKYVPEIQGGSPRNSGLAPDSFGNPIPEDAKWTRIRRSLVSPEVLAQDGRRYEARPEFVAVLGILSREEIEDYADRTLALRQARASRDAPPVQPPRPQRTIYRRQSSSEDDSDDDHNQQRRPRYREHLYRPDVSPRPRYVAPYGQSASVAMPVPVAAASLQQGWAAHNVYPPQSPNGWGRPPSPNYRVSHRPLEDRRRPQAEKKKPKSSWRNNLAAAGVGGAAGSLMSVLVEAAQDL